MNSKKIIPNSNLDNFLKNTTTKNTIVTHSIELPQSYIDLDMLEVRKKDIQKIQQACKNSMRTNNVIYEVLTNIPLGLSTTFFGFFISGFFSNYTPSQWQFWFSLVCSPILCTIFICAYVVVLVGMQNKKEDFRKIVIDKLLEPTNFWEEEEK